MSKSVALLAVKGLAGWNEYGSDRPGSTFSRGPYYNDSELTAYIRLDISEPLSSSVNAVGDIWKRPTLDLNLPPCNVRSMFEGCIGCGGSLSGHAWDGNLASLTSSDSVGLDVYVAVLRAYGAKDS
jgi:hypothetical protein